MKEGRGSGRNGAGRHGSGELESADEIHFPIGVFLFFTHMAYMDHCGLESPKCIRLDEVPRPGGFPGGQIDQNRLTAE